ncbi:hypothetical protein SERLA73DRAFT_166540 [Serpula lacrymans var. lacrymans S7.3]|uniref:CASTOR ACT domain-containing protein n=2 Tax=Serpula lacrymans var. lacrymans TaxID=341189 RepID=F8PPF9_SERL3|nr:hypothetical protein SERLA73DRAFT_166540 [Serpula lacrymans var. lacrymans S7.3]
MILLGSAGFDSYSSDPNLLTSRVVSPLLSPTSMDDSSVVELCPDFTSDGGAVLTRTRSSTDASISTIASALLINPQVTPEHSPISPRPSSRTKSHSPTSSEVNILSPNLACVGLSDDSVDTWGLKLIKLVAFPDLIPLPHKMPTTSLTRGPFSSRGRCPSDLQNKIHTGDQTSAPPLYGVVDFPSSSSDSSDSSEEEGYFSHSPRRNRSSSSLISSAASRSYPDLAKSAPSCDSSFKHPAKHLISPIGAPSSLNSPSASRRPAFLRSETSRSHTTVRHSRNGNRMSVPFFSFTRTPEGSSLTTDVSLLAALFPPAERHMVICGGELDALDAHSSSDSEDDEESDSESSTLKCLQIDLRRFGLDKHGLVNRFSRVLEQNGINHMYSSTFKTANLLVDKVDASRAQALLRSC